jgi:transcriptional regulator with XRE-family HTH domain
MSAQLYLIEGLFSDSAETKTRKIRFQFQDRLLMAMNRRGLQDADVVRATGISPSTLSQWVNGEIEAPVAGDHFKDVCRCLGVSSDFLLGLKDDF